MNKSSNNKDMVNLKEYTRQATINEQTFLKNASTFLRYVKKSDQDFIQKFLKSLVEIFKNEKTTSQNKFFSLHLVHLCLQIHNSYFDQIFAKVLAPTLVDLTILNFEKQKIEQIKQTKNKETNLNNDDEKQWTQHLNQLLLEAIEFWGINLRNDNPIFEKMFKEILTKGIKVVEEPSLIFTYMYLIARQNDKSAKKSEIDNHEKIINPRESQKSIVKNQPSQNQLKEQQNTDNILILNQNAMDETNAEITPKQGDLSMRECVKNETECYKELVKLIDWYLKTKQEPDDSINSYFERINRVVHKLKKAQKILNEEQEKILADGIYYLSCYERAKEYKDLQKMIIEYTSKMNLNEKVDPQIVKKRLNESKFSNKNRISEEMLKGEMLKDEILEDPKILSRKNLDVRNFPQSASKDSKSNFSKIENMVIVSTNNKESSIPKIINEQKKDIKIQSAREGNDLNHQLLDYIESERNQFKDKIEMLSRENRRLEQECKRKQKVLTEMEEKAKIDTNRIIKLEEDLRKSQELVEKFVSKVDSAIRGSIEPKKQLSNRNYIDNFGDYERQQHGIESTLFKKSQANIEKPNNATIDLESYKSSNYFPNFQTDSYSNFDQTVKNSYREPHLEKMKSTMIDDNNRKSVENLRINQHYEDVEKLKKTMRKNDEFVYTFNRNLSSILNRNNKTSENNSNRVIDEMFSQQNSELIGKDSINSPRKYFGSNYYDQDPQMNEYMLKYQPGNKIVLKEGLAEIQKFDRQKSANGNLNSGSSPSLIGPNFSFGKHQYLEKNFGKKGEQETIGIMKFKRS